MKKWLVLITLCSGIWVLNSLPSWAEESTTSDEDQASRSIPEDEVPTLSQPELDRKISNEFFNAMPQAAHDMDGSYEEPPLEDLEESNEE